MSRIYRVDGGPGLRERQHALPKGTVAEVWAESLPVARYLDLLRGDTTLGADTTGSPG